MPRLIALLLLAAFSHFAQAAPCPEETAKTAASESDLVIETRLTVVAETAGGRQQVTTLGKITNPTASCFEDLVVEVDYFDGGGKLVDTVTQHLRAVVVPAKATVNYRVIDTATQPKDAYASEKARVISAEPRFARAGKLEDAGLLANFLVSWGPMLLLMAVWVVAMGKYGGKKSPQYRAAATLERQLAVSEAHLKAVERIAAAAEAGRKD